MLVAIVKITRRVGHQGVTPDFAGYVAPTVVLIRSNTASTEIRSD
jgi:hypothetical protein